jgi:7-carboxy-7-deazaguanine synthase
MNQQTPSTREDVDASGTYLNVHSTFYTIQGEGPFSGRPAVFIRLHGCNLRCPGCDTEYTSLKRRVKVTELVASVTQLWPRHVPGRKRLYVITGGEPLRQNLNLLIRLLQDSDATVQIETNGTLAPLRPEKFPKGVYVVCSPKSGRVNIGLLPYISAYKYVVDADNVSPEDGLPTSILLNDTEPARPHTSFKGPIFITPMDPMDGQTTTAKERNRKAVLTSALRFNYTAQLQIHKALNTP